MPDKFTTLNNDTRNEGERNFPPKTPPVKQVSNFGTNAATQAETGKPEAPSPTINQNFVFNQNKQTVVMNFTIPTIASTQNSNYFVSKQGFNSDLSSVKRIPYISEFKQECPM